MDFSYHRSGEHIEGSDDPPIHKLNPALKWGLRFLLPLLFVCTLLLVYSGLFDPIIYDKAGEWLAFAVMFIIGPVLVSGSWRVWTPRTWRSVGYVLAAASVLINGPIYGVWSGRHEERVFRSTGIRTKAVVTRAFYSEGDEMYYEFEVKGEPHESFSTYNPARYRVGDTIDIIYARDIPNMNTPVELLGK